MTKYQFEISISCEFIYHRFFLGSGGRFEWLGSEVLRIVFILTLVYEALIFSACMVLLKCVCKIMYKYLYNQRQQPVLIVTHMFPVSSLRTFEVSTLPNLVLHKQSV